MFIVEVVAIFTMILVKYPLVTLLTAIGLIIYDNYSLYSNIKKERLLLAELQKTAEKQKDAP